MEDTHHFDSYDTFSDGSSLSASSLVKLFKE
jgi:hypothetical protein